MKFNSLSAALAFLILACTQNYLPCTPNEDLWKKATTIEIRKGYTICNIDQNVGIRFKEVVSDSRCPIDAVCISAGEVTVAFEIVKGQEVLNTFNLSDQATTTEISVNGNMNVIKLLEVSPMPTTSTTIIERSYSAKVEITPS